MRRTRRQAFFISRLPPAAAAPLPTPINFTAIRQRMEIFDSLPPTVRNVYNGIPVSNLVMPVINDGCLTQADAEEWMRSIFGKDVLTTF